MQKECMGCVSFAFCSKCPHGVSDHPSSTLSMQEPIISFFPAYIAGFCSDRSFSSERVSWGEGERQT